MSTRSSLRRFGRRTFYKQAAFSLMALCGLTAISLVADAAPQMGTRTLAGHLPAVVAQSNLVGPTAPTETVDLAVALPLRNQAQLTDLLNRLYNPADPLYGQYLTPEEFTNRFGPTQADYDAVAAYFESQGFTVTQRHPNRLILDVSAPASKAQIALGVALKNYRLPSGRIFRAPNAEPTLPTNIANRIQGVIGLDTAGVRHPHYIMKRPDPLAFLNTPQAPNSTGLTPFGMNLTPKFGNGPGPYGGLTPTDIKTAYDLNVNADGSNQTLGLFELDGYVTSDITTYEDYYGIGPVPLENVYVDGYNGRAGNGAGEVTLDIQLMTALAPNAAKIIVYEGPNSGNGSIDTFNKIATENRATTVSTSWGLPEQYNSAAERNAENAVFQQMAAQGQSIFDASGDSGAYDDGATLCVDDPANQPYMTGVGGTTLTLNANGTYKSETTWNWGGAGNGGGGGGISQYFNIPNYQSQAGVITAPSLASTTKRNVPDVSLDADPDTGYSMYQAAGGGWTIVGGTSCAAPLWAAFTALVNQFRLSISKPVIGFINPTIYSLGTGNLTGASYANDMHDIADGSDNQFYPAVKGFDDATGWGTFAGFNLLADLSGVTPVRIPPLLPAQLMGDPGFENGWNYAPWVVTSTALVSNNPGIPAATGSWKAVLGNTSTRHTDKLYQKVTIPANYKRNLTLSYALYQYTTEARSQPAIDTLTVMIRDASNTSTLETLATYSNKTYYSVGPGYNTYTHTLNLKKYSGQTVTLMFQFTQSGLQPTAMLLDDITLTIR